MEREEELCLQFYKGKKEDNKGHVLTYNLL